MELLNFLKSLRRYRAILILVPLATAAFAYTIAHYVPDKYTSRARLSSAIADKSQQLVEDNQQPESSINEEFDNLLQTLTLNKILYRVSYKLLIHDLEDSHPFRRQGSLTADLSAAQKADMISKLTSYYDEGKALSPLVPDEKNIYKILKLSKYDDQYLKKHISAYHVDNSEYINLEYSSENPQLSAFVLNTLANEFINYYTSVFSANKNRSLKFLDSLMTQKQSDLTNLMEMLKNYKINNGILNVDDQAKTIYGQLADMETKKANAEKDMVAYSSALTNIDNRFKPDNRKYLESSVSALNSKIINTKEQIGSINDAYIQSGFNEKYKAKIDSLQKNLTQQIYDQSDNYAYNPTVAKDNLVAQKLTLEVSKDLAQNSVQSLDNEIGKLNRSLQRLVPNLATIQALQGKIEVANKEYQDVLQKYNQASLEANYNSPVRLVEKASPGDPEPNKKIQLVGLSTVASFVLCLLVFFTMFFFDHSIHSSEQLQYSLDFPVIGTLNRVNGKSLNLQELWNGKVTDSTGQQFKNSLRSIRHELESTIQDGSVLAITSLNEGEGKTFVTISLAYAFSTINKKVLIIDGNFNHPDISNNIGVPNYIEKYLSDSRTHKEVNDSINVIGNKGGDNSLLELTNGRDIKNFFSVLKTVYDVILIETSAFESLNKANAREWIDYSDKVLVVFESGRTITSSLVSHIRYLRQLGNKLTGMVLNKYVPAVVSVKKKFDVGIQKSEKLPSLYGA